jgi:hypothetical protein
MILSDLEVASLKSALRCWERFGYISTGIVFLGCVGEFVAEFTSVPKSKEVGSKLARLSLIVLILGIAGELLSAVQTSQLSGQLIANIEERAGTAEQKAGEANDRAEANKKEAEQLHKEAESERLARVEIEESIAWRTITLGDEKLISSRMALFREEQFVTSYNAGDAEGAAFAWEVAGALNKAKLRVFSPDSLFGYEPGGRLFDSAIAFHKTGIEVTSTESSQSAAKALVQSLLARGFNAALAEKLDARQGRGVWISIHTRPKGPQGAAKLRAETKTGTQVSNSWSSLR